MPTKCCWVIHGSLTSERKASTSPSSFNESSITRPCCSIERSSAKLLVRLHALRSSSTRQAQSERVDALGRRTVEVRGNHMDDHSRFQRDINDVTGVSLSLSLSLSQKSLTHNIGSASALPIICERGGREWVSEQKGASQGNTGSKAFCKLVLLSGNPRLQLHSLRWSPAGLLL